MHTSTITSCDNRVMINTLHIQKFSLIHSLDQRVLSQCDDLLYCPAKWSGIKMNYTRLLVWKLSSPLFFKYKFLKGQKEPWRGKMNWKQIVTVTFCPLSSPCHFLASKALFPLPCQAPLGLEKVSSVFCLCSGLQKRKKRVVYPSIRVLLFSFYMSFSCFLIVS